MKKPALPPWWAKARPLVGVFLTLLLISVVALRATGVMDGEDVQASAEETDPSPSDSPSLDLGSPSQTPPAPASETPKGTKEPEPKKDQGKDQDEGKDEGKDKGKDKGTKEGRQGQIEGELVEQVEDLLGTDEEPAPEPAVFRVSSFNVLGHSHTVARGNKPQYAEGPTRMRWAVQLLRGYDIDVVGFQEFEMVQLNAFRRITGGSYGVYPGGTLGRNPVRNSIAWRQDTWRLVSARTIPIPYFRGNRVPMPYVLLEHVSTGQQVFFINVHNPASVKGRGNNEPWRDLGTRLEIGLAKRLHAATDLPVVLMGDFNERAEVFCKVVGQGGMIAANGGSAAPCRPPANHGIDWIFGTNDISFSDYVRSRSGLIARTTDHPIIVSTAQVG